MREGRYIRIYHTDEIKKQENIHNPTQDARVQSVDSGRDAV